MIIYINNETKRKLSLTHERLCRFTDQVSKTEFACMSGIIDKIIYLYVIPVLDDAWKSNVFEFKLVQGFPRILDLTITRMSTTDFNKIVEELPLTVYPHSDGVETLKYMQTRDER